MFFSKWSERSRASITYWLLMVTTFLVGTVTAIGTILLIDNNWGVLFAKWLISPLTTVLCFVPLMFCFESGDRQVIHFARHRFAKVQAYSCILGIYGSLVLLGFGQSRFGALFWNGPTGWQFCMRALTIGAVMGLVGFAWKYATLLWPRDD